MSLKERQQTDSKQGGEGTTSFHGKSYDPMLKSINEGRGVDAERSKDKNLPPIDEGTK